MVEAGSDVFPHIKCIRNISTLLQMGDADKDFRYMALTDLMGELQKESLSLDSDSEEKVPETLS